MVLYRRILSADDGVVDGWSEWNYTRVSSLLNGCCNALSPPSIDIVRIDIDDSNRHLSDVVIIAISVIAAVFFLSVTCYVYAIFRRRRRHSLPPHAAISVPAGAGAGAATTTSPRSDDEGASEDGEWLHPVWYIRTVGLDESTIKSIAVTEYKAGGAILGAADCSVCLGEFQDGELVRLLPKCGHAFHVPCIDTWLRAHVNCPLCRACIVDPAGKLVGEAPPPPATATAAPISVEGSSSSAPVDNPNTGIQASESDPRVQDREEEDRGMESGTGIGILINQLPESSEIRVPSDLEEGGLQPVRRSVSMDSPFLGTLPITMEREESPRKEAKDPNFGEEQRLKNKGKQGNSSKRSSLPKGHLEIERSLSSGRWFFSRYGRVARNSILPL